MAKNATAGKARPNFGSLLDTKADDVERPKARPEGSYLFVVKGMPRMDKSSKKQTEFVEFTLACVKAGNDVDEEMLKEAGGIADWTTRATYYLTDGALWRLKDFLESCGITVEGRTLREALDDTPNCQVGGYIKHEPSQDGETIFARLGKTFHADDFNAEEGDEADED